MHEPRPAGFWIRAAAAVIDLLVVALVRGSFDAIARVVHGAPAGDAWAAGSTVTTFTLVFAAGYTTALHAFGGQTIGKALVGVRVVGAAGEPPTTGQAFLRFLAYALSLVPFCLGYLMAGLRRDKRALHDLVAGTRVVRTRGVTAPPDRDATPVDTEAGELVPPIG